MDIEIRIFSLIQIIIFILIIFLTFIYSIPIICFRRFHHANNILTLNVCIATIFCGLSWLLQDLITICCGLSWLVQDEATMFDNDDFFKKAMVFLYFAETTFTIQVPFSLVAASIHRYCSLVYHTNNFFKRKQWIILCIGSQWIVGFVLLIPNLTCLYNLCAALVWPSIYAFASIVIAPSIMCSIINKLIYNHVRSSSRRIQPSTVSGNFQQRKINSRDIVLLRHMVLMFCIFVGGWTPIFILPIIHHYMPISTIVHGCLTIWCELALLSDVIDLFLYNHELRKYLKSVYRRRFRLEPENEPNRTRTIS